MRIYNKLTFFVIALLTTLIAVIVWFNIYYIRSTSSKQMETFKSRERHRVEQQLTSYLDIAYGVIDANYKNSTDMAFLEKYYGKRLVSIIDSADSLLKFKADQVRKGQISIEKAKSEAMAEISRIKFDNGSGYIFIINTDRPCPTILMHPVSPTLENKSMADPIFNTALGRGVNLGTAIVDVCLKNGEGFVDYVWDKPTPDGMVPDVPKLSFGRLFPEWQWIVCTGIYIDDAITDSMEKSRNNIKQMRYDNGTGYIFIINTDYPYPKILMHPVSPALENKPMSDPMFNTALGQGVNLGTAMVDVCLKNGEGFVDYAWNKPTEKGIIPNAPKLSYAKLYKPLNWIIGTGVYVDDIDKIISEHEQMLNRDIRNLSYKIVGFSAVLFILLSIFLKFIFKRYYFRRDIDRQKAQQPPPPMEPDDDRIEIIKTTREIGKVMKALNAILQTTKEATPAAKSSAENECN